jgi:phosphate transport system substrate-binding protein
LIAAAVIAFPGSVVSARAAEITCASAESMAELMETWTREFSALYPAAPARVVVRTKFSAEAFDALLRGEVQVAPFARELFPSERARFHLKFGRDPLLLPIAFGSRATKGGTHAIAIFVSAKNPLAQLSLSQLRSVLARDGGITTWGQLGLGGEWARRPIVVHGMLRRRTTGDPPGIVNFLEQRLLGGLAWRDDIVEHADVPGGPQALELIVRAIAADSGAIGYSGFGYALPGTKTVALAEVDGGPWYAGTSGEIADGTYPLTRKIYLCADRAAVRENPSLRLFLEFTLGAAGQKAVAAVPQGFFPLPGSERDAARTFLDAP